jgi:hypothetical protein
MKLTLLAGLGLSAVLPHAPEPTVRVLREPSFGRDLLLVLEHEGAEVERLWAARGVELDAVRSAGGEELDVSPGGPRLAKSGERDPTRRGFEDVADGRALVWYTISRPSEEVRSIPRFAGRYELLRGGEARPVDVPIEQPAEPAPWEDETLAEAGVELSVGLRELPQVHLRLTGDLFEVAELELFAAGAEDGLPATIPGFDPDAMERHFDLPGDAPEQLLARVTLEDGTVIELDDLPAKEEYRRVRDKALAKADLELEARRMTAREVHGEGAGEWAQLRGFRWVDRRGKPVGLHPESTIGSGAEDRVELTCRVPAELPRGARLVLDVLVGATWEPVRFEATDLEVPAR